MILKSVIIPTRNRAERLKNLLTCLSTQTISPDEVIVVDNSSTDETKEVVLSFETKLPVKYLLGRKIGPSFARNAGIRKASGDFLIFLDDDCLVEKTFIEKMAVCNSFGEEYIFWPKIVFKFGARNMASDFFLFFFEAKARVQKLEWPLLGKVKGYQITRGLHPAAFAVFKESLKCLDYWFDEDFFSSFGEGPDLVIRMSLKGFTIVLLDDIRVTNLTTRLGLAKLVKKSFLFGLIHSALKNKYKEEMVDSKVADLFKKEIKGARKQDLGKKVKIFLNTYKKHWKRQNFVNKMIFPIFSLMQFVLIIIGLFCGWVFSSFYYKGE